MDFLTAMTSEDLLGENWMPTHSTSGSAIVDMFFTMGASRGLTPRNIIRVFVNALADDPLLALKAMFYNRDIRGGQGERRSFRIMFWYLCHQHPEFAIKNLYLVPHFGRWDDIFMALDTEAEIMMLEVLAHGLISKETRVLCAKWLPREGKARDAQAKYLMGLLEVSPREYRKRIAHNELGTVVETLMCKNLWGEIDYSKVPSKAINKYRKAWARHDLERYTAWVKSLLKGEDGATIHAGAIFPHDIVRPFLVGSASGIEADQLEAQWGALPNYMPEGFKILPVCDVSGSMHGLPMEVCISLGLYLSERNLGPFHNMFITFSRKPALQHLTAEKLRDRVYQLRHAHWNLNTDLEAMFQLVLGQAVKHNLPPEELPQVLLILSDMQFDRCVSVGTDTAMKMIRRVYREAGYELPQVVFWNLRTSIGVPVKFDERGTALVSGFSPSIMTNLLGGELEPMKIVLKVLNSERYEAVTV